MFTSLLLDASGLWGSKKYPSQKTNDAIPKLIGGRCKDSNSKANGNLIAWKNHLHPLHCLIPFQPSNTINVALIYTDQ